MGTALGLRHPVACIPFFTANLSLILKFILLYAERCISDAKLRIPHRLRGHEPEKATCVTAFTVDNVLTFLGSCLQVCTEVSEVLKALREVPVQNSLKGFKVNDSCHNFLLVAHRLGFLRVPHSDSCGTENWFLSQPEAGRV